MEENSYNAQNITVLKDLEAVRKNYNLNVLASQIDKRGSILQLSRHLGINHNTLSRAIEEAKILTLFPTLSKSKANPLSRLKTKKELILFTKKHNIFTLSCRKLYKAVKEWRLLIEKNPRILLTEEQHDLIIGSVLGDANIRQRDKNCCFRVSHSKKQEKYLYWKYSLLKEFITTPIYSYKKMLKNHIIETLDFSTFTHQVFNFYYKLIYKNGKKTVTRELLDMLNPRSLSIWICDDGSFGTKQPYIILCTNSYSLEEHNIIKKYFEEIWNLSPTIGFRDKKYYYLRFKQKDTEKLINIIRPFILDSMEYKIGEKNE